MTAAVAFRVVFEAVAAFAVVAVAVACFRASVAANEGMAGAATRICATLLLPSLLLGSLHAFYWPAALVLSLAAAVWQWRSTGDATARVDVRDPRLAWLLIPGVLALVLLGVRAALSLASPPYDFDSVLYHLPMAVEFVQAHTVIPAQVMFHPGNSELLLALGLGVQGSLGGQTLGEAIVAAVLFLAAYGVAEEAGATPPARFLAACAALAVPMIGDLLFTAQNDVLVAAMLLAFVALWSRAPALSALALGIVAGVKFTGCVEAAFMLPLLWSRRSPQLSWRHAALAAVVAAPWYLRNAVQTGNPFFLGDQTTGFASSIAGQIGSALPLALAAIRNFGGLLALLGIVGGALLIRDRGLKGTLAPLLLALAAAVVLAWFVTPNSAYVHAGTLDAIATGWSVRYGLFAMAILNIAAILWLARLNEVVAGAVASLSLAFTLVRTFRQMHEIDPGTAAFLVPLVLVGAAIALCFVLPKRWALPAGAAACAAFALLSASGAVRIATMWNSTYARFGNFDFATALSSPDVANARRVATLQMLPLPIMGAHLERYVIADKSGLPLQAWWETLRAAHPDVVVGADVPIGAGGMNERELYLRNSGLYRLVSSSAHTRIYLPR